jgi:hypothetical protein
VALHDIIKFNMVKIESIFLLCFHLNVGCDLDGISRREPIDETKEDRSPPLLIATYFGETGMWLPATGMSFIAGCGESKPTVRDGGGGGGGRTVVVWPALPPFSLPKFLLSLSL